MPRGFTYCVYEDDSGTSWSLKVDADYALEASRGWIPVGDTPPPVLSRGWLPRVAVGLDATGRQRKAVVANTTADLWTGVASTFVIEGNDQVDYECTVIALLGEQPPKLTS